MSILSLYEEEGFWEGQGSRIDVSASSECWSCSKHWISLSELPFGFMFLRGSKETFELYFSMWSNEHAMAPATAMGSSMKNVNLAVKYSNSDSRLGNSIVTNSLLVLQLWIFVSNSRGAHAGKKRKGRRSRRRGEMPIRPHPFMRLRPSSIG